MDYSTDSSLLIPLLLVIHEPENLADVYVNRTELYTSAATYTGYAILIFIYIVFQLVHKTLPHPLYLNVPRVVP